MFSVTKIFLQLHICPLLLVSFAIQALGKNFQLSRGRFVWKASFSKLALEVCWLEISKTFYWRFKDSSSCKISILTVTTVLMLSIKLSSNKISIVIEVECEKLFYWYLQKCTSFTQSIRECFNKCFVSKSKFRYLLKYKLDSFQYSFNRKRHNWGRNFTWEITCFDSCFRKR